MDSDPDMFDNNNVEKSGSEEADKEEEEEEEEGDSVLVKIPPPPPGKAPTPATKAPTPDAKMNGVAGEEGKPALPDAVPTSQSLRGSIFPVAVSPAAERIRFILGEEDAGPAPPQLFTELDELLSVDGQDMEWKETAR